MRPTTRLFRIIQLLRSAKQPITASAIADELETSTRTIYRDIAELMAQRVPIRGEAGVGYVLDKNYNMPPLMLRPNELEAAVLGAQWVAQRGDSTLVRGARDLIAKICAVTPLHLRSFIVNETLMAPMLRSPAKDAIDIDQVREWIHRRHKLRLRYRSEDNRESERIIWPIAIAYFEVVRLIVAWCEVRSGFRHFRTDRILSIEFMDQIFPNSLEELHGAWRRQESSRESHELDGCITHDLG